MKKSLFIFTISALTTLCFADPVWTETGDSTTSKRKVTDGNFVVGWDGTGGTARRLYYVSHDASVGTVLDMTTLCSDMEAAGITYPNIVNTSGFLSVAGITRIVFPEEIPTFYQQACSSMPDLESVVISSKTTWSAKSYPKQVFSSCGKLSTITPRGVTETNGVIYLPEGCTSIAHNMLQACKNAQFKHVIASWATSVEEAAFQYCNNLESVTVSKDLSSIKSFAFEGCSSLTNLVAGDNSFEKFSDIGGSKTFTGCSKLAQKFDFSKSVFTSMGYQAMYGANGIPEIHFPATLTSVAGSALRADTRPVQRLIYFYGAPPTFNDGEKLALGSTNNNPTPRFIVFIKDEYKDQWLELFATDAFNEITDADKARTDYPTKSDVVRVPESRILGTSTFMAHFNGGNKLSPYYVCTFVEPNMPLSIIIR
ncbi:MAG: leucine-rich repeat protein [Kiritimatiellae bacterium]|nr:leucine-rich repeat protein [Kiritimatiellia bacterium]